MIVIIKSENYAKFDDGYFCGLSNIYGLYKAKIYFGDFKNNSFCLGSEYCINIFLRTIMIFLDIFPTI